MKKIIHMYININILFYF